MRRLSLLVPVLLSAVLGTSTSSAQVAGEWTREPLSLPSIAGVACSRDEAFVRSWPGAVAAYDGHVARALPPVPAVASGAALGVTPGGHPIVGVDAAIDRSYQRIAIFDGEAWREHPIAWPGMARRIEAVFAVDDAHAYFATEGAVGALDEGTFRLYDAGTWRALSAIAGTLDDLWAVGQGGTVMHHDAWGWHREVTRTDAWIRGITAVSHDEAWAWSGAALFHRTSIGWPRAAIGSPVGTVRSVVVAHEVVHVVGTGGVARGDASGWVPELDTSTLGTSTIVGGCATETFLFVALSNGEAMVRRSL